MSNRNAFDRYLPAFHKAFPGNEAEHPVGPPPHVPPQAVADKNASKRFGSKATGRIGRANQFALALAARGRSLRDYVSAEVVRQEREQKHGQLCKLFQTFRNQLSSDLTLEEFADAFAQLLAYGLFLARLNSDLEPVTLCNARRYVPYSFRPIREVADFLRELEDDEYRDLRSAVEDLLSLVNRLNLPAIHEDLSFRQRKTIGCDLQACDEDERRLFERDPFIYFYEDFLKAYDAVARKSRGVYYTPPPIVNFIVRAIDDILKESFHLGDGLAEGARVTVLDFACGTGTFLLEVFRRIFANIGAPRMARGEWIVRAHLLKNLFGFECQIIPYIIAHLKLSQYLKEQNYRLEEDERLQVFLTNTLEPMALKANVWRPAISTEVETTPTDKQQPILVITGNPPYSGHSRNKGPWIAAAIEAYKFTWDKTADGLDERKPLGEKNPKWLQDDYVKFIRFAQMKMDGFSFKTVAPDGKSVEHFVPGVENGVVGVITNHRWLDNPTFRGMRQSLMRSFNQIYVWDLHGYIEERAPDGSDDENVFDIKQGVAISIFVKRPGLERGVWRGDLWGKRLQKYRAAAEATMKSVDWRPLEPVAPFYLFARQDAQLRGEYQEGWRLTEILPTNVLGFQTHRDDFAVSFTESEMVRKLEELTNFEISDEELARRYGLKSNRDWSFADARIAARNGAATPPRLIAYRPFDERWSEFSGLTMDYPRRELLDHVAGRANLTLLVPRGISTAEWRHAFIADKPANDCVISSFSREANQVFPIWRFGAADIRHENFAPDFRTFIDERYEHHYTPEQILGYIYAVLYAGTYRTRYAAFLRIDFPRVPFPESGDDFEMLSGLGWGLVQAHLLRELPRYGLAAYHGKGDHMVEVVRYSPADQSVAINKTQFFKPVPQAVWEFRIGGYQVLDKYLKSRKGRTLSLDEMTHVGAIADSLAFTIEQMAQIDETYCSVFSEPK